jgi:hypothetical protein
MLVRILYHDHCFDGAASAAYFGRFIKDRFYPNAQFAYTGMAHTASQLFEDGLFDGDENAIVDFKYSPHPRLTWWFDHHQSAFLTKEDAEHYRLTRTPQKLYDPDFRSCTKFIATKTREQWGYDAPDLAGLVRWADIVDGARYKDADEAVSLASAATKLTLVIESAKGSESVQSIIRMMQTMPLDDIADSAGVQALYQPLYARHLRTIDIIRSQAKCDGKVVFFDLIEHELEGYNKFIPYYLFPESVYTVSVSVSTFRTKVSVGSNPWVAEPLRHNLATICERYGGGGHAKVGAISFPIGAVEQARKAAAEITAELRD